MYLYIHVLNSVCVLPPESLPLTVSWDSSIQAFSCIFGDPCLSANCTCRNVCVTECGALLGTIYVSVRCSYAYALGEWLQVIGIANIQTQSDGLEIPFTPEVYNLWRRREWEISIFPNLQVNH